MYIPTNSYFQLSKVSSVVDTTPSSSYVRIENSRRREKLTEQKKVVETVSNRLVTQPSGYRLEIMETIRIEAGDYKLLIEFLSSISEMYYTPKNTNSLQALVGNIFPLKVIVSHKTIEQPNVYSGIYYVELKIKSVSLIE